MRSSLGTLSLISESIYFMYITAVEGFEMGYFKSTYGRKSADRTEPHFGVIFFVFLSTFFGNLEVCDVKTCNIF